MSLKATSTRSNLNFPLSLLRSFHTLVILATLVGLARPMTVQATTQFFEQDNPLSPVQSKSTESQVQTANFQASTMTAMGKNSTSPGGNVTFPNLAQLVGPMPIVGDSHGLPPGTHVYTSDPSANNHSCSDPDPSATEASMPYRIEDYGPFNLGHLGPYQVFYICADEGNSFIHLKAEALGSGLYGLGASMAWDTDLQGNAVPSEMRPVIPALPVLTLWEYVAPIQTVAYRWLATTDRLIHLEGGQYSVEIFATHLDPLAGTRSPYSLLEFDIDYPRATDDQNWSQESACTVATPDRFALHPVNTRIGNFTHQETDFSIPTVSQPLEFTRSYNAQDLESSALGRGWTHNYNLRVEIVGYKTVTQSCGEGCWEYVSVPSEVVVISPLGSRLHYLVQNGEYIPAPGVRARLQNHETGYMLTRGDNLIYYFNSDGYLTSIVDSNGNAITMLVTGGLLRSATASDGRALT